MRTKKIITKLNKNLAGDQSGFTLMELLVAMGIMGSLAAIAMPSYVQFKAKAYDAQAQSMLRDVAQAEELYFIDNETYISCDQSTCPSLLAGLYPISSDITLTVTATSSTYTATITHAKGTGKTFTRSG